MNRVSKMYNDIKNIFGCSAKHTHPDLLQKI